jgi:hypothetical protein
MSLFLLPGDYQAGLLVGFDITDPISGSQVLACPIPVGGGIRMNPVIS